MCRGGDGIGCLEEAYSIISAIHINVQDYEEVDVSTETARLIENMLDSCMVIQEKIRPNN